MSNVKLHVWFFMTFSITVENDSYMCGILLYSKILGVWDTPLLEPHQGVWDTPLFVWIAKAPNASTRIKHAIVAR